MTPSVAATPNSSKILAKIKKKKKKKKKLIRNEPVNQYDQGFEII